jgi:hypothetical protein
MSGTALRKMAGVQRECCQVAVIPAKNLKRAQRKKSWPEEFVAEFWPNFAIKEPKKFFERNSLFYSND